MNVSGLAAPGRPGTPGVTRRPRHMWHPRGFSGNSHRTQSAPEPTVTLSQAKGFVVTGSNATLYAEGRQYVFAGL
jgi:hypothetical protein